MTEKKFGEERRNYLNCESLDKPISTRTIGELMCNEGINLDQEAVERAQRDLRRKYSLN